MINPSTDCGGPAQWAHALILPWITFALLYAALYTRMIRANVMEAMNEDYVRTARAKGAPEWLVMRSHILRNAMLPIITMLGLDIGVLLGGAIFTETVFGLPGHRVRDVRDHRDQPDRRHPLRLGRPENQAQLTCVASTSSVHGWPGRTGNRNAWLSQRAISHPSVRLKRALTVSPW
jgi:hypothetical protein